MPTLTLQVPAELRFLLPPGRRQAQVEVAVAATDTVGHVVQAAGVPLTEVGRLTLDGVPVAAGTRAVAGVLALHPVVRPQPAPTSPPRFLLDVHLGGLARRLRLLGLDAADDPTADDPELAERSAAEDRVLLTQDRGLLRRARVRAGALVRGSGTAAQLDDVLDRFAPPLAPWTRCTVCGTALQPVAAEAVAAQLQPGTRRSYEAFARCASCQRLYWRGAHAARLGEVVARAEQVVAQRRSAVGFPSGET